MAKVFKQGVTPNMEIQDNLEQIDPDETRYIRYHKCMSGEFPEEVVFMRKLKPLDTTKMTRKQYRYLRDSIDLLHKNGISHGDLPGNVMVSDDDLPRIIDWETSRLNDEIAIGIDKNAFYSTQFKVEK